MALIGKDIPSVIAKGVVIKGNIENGQNIEIEGKIEGDITAKIVTIRENGVVNGNVKCEIFNISGTFDGNVNSDKINIADTSVVNGTLEYNFLSVDFGATINCELKRITQNQKKIIDVLKTGDAKK
ncbi:MAG: polymer-forming cytoskeletal protein [Rickettsiales bacterium]|nr:polymer-forming cytoskeletal protein [Rickettsiales bacterium]